MQDLLWTDGRQRCEVRPAKVGMGVFATEAIPMGAEVVILPPVFADRTGRHTIQLDEGRHQAYTGDVDDYLNHSCHPNTYVDPEGLRFVALRPIAAGAEVTFNYSASEWDMAEPFECGCDGVRRIIRGFRHLSPAERDAIAHRVPAWLLARLHVT